MNHTDTTMPAVEHIRQERIEQLNKHGFTIEHDKEVNYLIPLAQYLMLGQDDAEKDNLAEYLFGDNSEYKLSFTLQNKLDNKPIKEQLVIAAALIAAKIDTID